MQKAALKMLDQMISEKQALSCYLVVNRTWRIKRQNVGQPLRIIKDYS